MSLHLLPQRAPARVIDPIVRALAVAGVTPNALTVAGLLGSAAAGVLAARGELPAAGVVLLLASTLDMLDGALARATDRVTPFGGLLDSTLDRLSEAAVLFGVLWHEIDAGHREQSLLVFVVVVGSLLVSYVRARSEAAGVSITAGLFTRPERVVLLGAALITGWLRPALWALAVLTAVTVLHRLVAAAVAMKDEPR